MVFVMVGFRSGEHEAMEGSLGSTTVQSSRASIPDGSGELERESSRDKSRADIQVSSFVSDHPCTVIVT